jgi:hypothetical protein
LYLINYIDNNYDIYVAVLQDSIWGKMKPLSDINTRFQESSACISADGYYLYFASNRPGGEGGFDIYRTTREDGRWAHHVNIGSIINTEGDEDAPFLTRDGMLLFFSSNGHESVGNMDILYSEINEKGGWKEPINIGVPINTTNDDLFYVYFKEIKSGFLSCDRAEGFGKNDIYRVQIGEIQKPEFSETTKFEKIAKMDLSEDHRNKLNSIILTTSINDMIPDTTHTFHVKDTSNIYTIQIMALENPISTKEFSISPLLVSPGDDGLFRYTYGEYSIYSEALLILYEIRESGFSDAFIRKITTVQNYSGKQNQ